MRFNRFRIIMALLLALPPFWAPSASALEDSAPQVAIEQCQPPAPAVAANAGLTAQPWRLEELTGEAIADRQAAPYLLFTNGGELFGFGGCNYYRGKYRTREAGKIVISSLRASHQKCPETSQQETTLLTSLVLANTMQVADTGLAFALDGSPLLKLAPATDVPVKELLEQTKQLKSKKKARKARGKKKKAGKKSSQASKVKAAKATGKAKTKVKAAPTPKKSGKGSAKTRPATKKVRTKTGCLEKS